ncbi:MFS transporter, partial [Staphylococcus sp. GCP4]|nr:MFS transporter [Staphylococcus sp. GCP4]
MKTGSEAIRALAMQIPAFRQKLSDGWYQVRIAGRDAGETELSARLNGLGGDYSVGHTLLAEFSPRRHRGVLLGAFSVVWTVGYVLASIAGHYFISESPEAWRWLLASAALPALLITLLRWGTPESPRWLLRQGRFAE